MSASSTRPPIFSTIQLGGRRRRRPTGFLPKCEATRTLAVPSYLNEHLIVELPHSHTPPMSASSTRPPPIFSTIQLGGRPRRRPTGFLPKCEASPPPDPAVRPAAPCSTGRSAAAGLLQVGSPVIVVEAPATLKTATAMPCLRVNDGLVKPGDVGRIVARKPKDMWAVRLAIGTYLIDGKHFQPLDVGEEETS